MRWAVLALLVSCYSPSPEAGAPCSPAGACPTPLVCRANACVAAGAPGPTTDAPLSSVDGIGGDAPSATVDASFDATDNPTGAVLLLHMDDDLNGGALDSAGGHTVACGAKCPFEIQSGRIGGAYRFKGQEELDVTPSADFDPTNAFSLVLWVRLDAAVGSGTEDGFYLLASKNLNDDATYALLVDTAMNPAFYTTGGATNGTTGDIGSDTLSTGAWHHLAITWDGHTATGYLDGAPETSSAVSAMTVDATLPLSIGLAGGVDGLVGDLDELAYYNRALTPGEVSALANP